MFAPRYFTHTSSTGHELVRNDDLTRSSGVPYFISSPSDNPRERGNLLRAFERGLRPELTERTSQKIWLTTEGKGHESTTVSKRYRAATKNDEVRR